MNYIKFFLLLLVVFATTASAPRVFAVTTELPDWTIDSSGNVQINSCSSSIANPSDYDQEYNGIYTSYAIGGDACFGGGAFGNMVSVYGASTTPYIGGFRFTSNGGVDYKFFRFSFSGSTFSKYENATNTRILSVFPEDGSTYPPGNYQFESDVYLNLTFNPYANEFIWIWENIDIQFQPIPLKGQFYIEGFTSVTSTSTYLGPGHYVLQSYFWNSTDNDFYYGTTTSFTITSGSYSTSTTQQIGDIVASTTAYVSTVCSPVATSTNIVGIGYNSSFSVGDCVKALVIPDQTQITYLSGVLKDNVSSHFPLGYVTDFLDILTSNATSSLTVIDATVPSVLPGSGARIRLDLNGVLNPILNATTSIFINSSASSTQTFYQITSYYFNYLIYILTVLYIIGRIIGKHLVPNFGFYTNSETGKTRFGRYNAREDNLFDD